MKTQDIGAFGTALGATFALYEKTVTPEVAMLWFEMLKEFELTDIRAALVRHGKDPVKGEFWPKPAHIVAYLAGRSGAWLTPDEAWARASLACDENNTVVLCAEIADALATVKHLIDAGDTFNAPRAFRDAYARNVDTAKLKRSSPRWFVSDGFDKQQRLTVTAKAIEGGFIAIADGGSSVPLLAGPGDVKPDDERTKIGHSRIADALAILRAPKEKRPRDKSPDMAAADEERDRQQREADDYMKGAK